MQTTEASKLLDFASFLVPSSGSLSVDLALLPSSEAFRQFVDHIFMADYFFVQLDYHAFLSLLNDFTEEALYKTVGTNARKTGLLRFASDIEQLAAERKTLYKKPVLDGDQAFYLFEPLIIEKMMQVPICAIRPDGSQEILRVENKQIQIKGILNIDEFVAALWLHGLRFGIDILAVKEIINSAKMGRFAIARAKEPTLGTDANLIEVGSQLHQDDSPLKLPNGVIDLKHFGSHFPQVKQNDLLMQKISCQPGKAGTMLDGQSVAAPEPEDFDLDALAGPGTQVLQNEDGEFIVASQDGFLNIDTVTNLITVQEKIINRSGVSMKTTGDLALAGDYYEEHGEVQEKRVIEGKNITILADVYGDIISKGGLIELKQNLVGGSALNHNGDIRIDGLISNATIQAKTGTVTLNRAENSTIIAKIVIIASAIHCTILAESIEIEELQAGSIAGKKMSVAVAKSRKSTPAKIRLLVPDLSNTKRKIAEYQQSIDLLSTKTSELNSKRDQLTAEPELKRFILITIKLQKREITLTGEQTEQMLKLRAKLSPKLSALNALGNEIKASAAEQVRLQEQIRVLEESCQRILVDGSCTIRTADPDTQIVKFAKEFSTLLNQPMAEIRHLLQEPLLAERCMPLQGDCFSWKQA